MCCSVLRLVIKGGMPLQRSGLKIIKVVKAHVRTELGTVITLDPSRSTEGSGVNLGDWHFRVILCDGT